MPGTGFSARLRLERKRKKRARRSSPGITGGAPRRAVRGALGRGRRGRPSQPLAAIVYVETRSEMLRVASALILLLGTSGSARALSVTAISPPAQAVAAAPTTAIVVDFDSPVDSSSVTPATFRVFGRWSGPMTGAIALDTGGARIRFVPDVPFFAGEWVTVSLSRGVRTAGGDSLSGGYAWNFWVQTTSGLLDLVPVDAVSLRRPGEGQIQSYGAYAGDLNNDGFSDMSVPNEISVDIRVCLNDGQGGYGPFTIFPLPAGASPSTNEGADFNGDGEIDLAVGNGGNDQLSVLFGDGSGQYGPEVAYSSGQSVRGVAVLDLDTDGDDDLVTANRSGNFLTLFYNDGAGAFDSSRVLEAGTSGETALAAADANADGIMDLFVGGFASQELVLLLGDGQGNLLFSDRIAAGGRPWMLAVGDINLDGHVDVAAANSFANNSAVAFGDGLGGFDSAVTYTGGLFTLAMDLGDVDGDGDLDMVTSHYSSAEIILLENDGTGAFHNPRTYPASSAGSCAILHDRDNDGDMDVSTIDEVDDILFLFENRCPIALTGDLDSSGTLTSADIIAMVNYVFKGGAEPAPCATAADVNCDTQVTSSDIIYLVNFVFKGGAAPCVACVCV